MGATISIAVLTLTLLSACGEPTSLPEDAPQDPVSAAWLIGEDAVIALAEAGNPGALFSLGDAYLADGKDPVKAQAWLTRAADLDHAKAQFVVGKSLLRGLDGFPADTAKGRELLEAAAQAGEPEAAFALAVNLRFGIDLKQDKLAALELYKQAEALGHEGAAAEIASLSTELNL